MDRGNAITQISYEKGAAKQDRGREMAFMTISLHKEKLGAKILEQHFHKKAQRDLQIKPLARTDLSLTQPH